MTAMPRLFTFLLLPLLFVTGLRAQSVHWDPNGGTLAAGQVVQLNLVFDQCEPKGDVPPPKVPGLEFGQPNRSQNSSFQFSFGGGGANKVTQSSVTLAYPVRAAAGQSTVAIPPFDVDTDQGRLHVAAASFTVGAATVGNNSQNPGGSLPLDSVAKSHVIAPATVWAGEVFPLSYTLEILQSYALDYRTTPTWTPAPLVVEDDWSDSKEKPTITKGTRNGEQLVYLGYQTRAYAKTAGEQSLGPITQVAVLQTGVQSFGFFSQATQGNYTITSAPATITIKPLPVPAPPEFSGAVGDFALEAKVVPDTVAVGEPVTWTLALNGTGNWPDISALPPRTVSRDFRVVTPSAKRSAKDKSLFDAALTEDIVLIPTKPGVYTLGPVKLACFDPKSGDYKNLTTKQFTVTVTGPVMNANPTPVGPGPGNVASTTTGPQIPNPPVGIPRDPLPPAPPAARPVALHPFVLLLLAPFGLLPILWMSLAARRAWLTDPLRPRRAARHRLAATLGGLRAHPAPDLTAQLLQRWQHDTAALFGVALAAPSAAALLVPPVGGVPPPRDPAIPIPAKKRGEGTPPTTVGSADWSALWHEADRTLYGDRQALPSDWLPRAESAFATKRVLGFQPLHLFLPRNLFPTGAAGERRKVAGINPAASTVVATLTVLLLLLSAFSFQPSAFAASAADAAYRSADFPAAEKSWRDALTAAPTDWSTQHNLALALAQQNRWGESAGHALAAFVQQPQNPAIQWHLDLALKNAGFTPEPVLPFLTDDPGARLAVHASPAQWQCLAGVGALLAALAPALLLCRAYGARGRWVGPLAWTALVAGLLLAGGAALSLRRYGPLADARAVVVWRAGVLRSIPTEADTTQKTTPLPAGLVAVADKTFLEGRWVRLAFPNGQTGWVRQEELVGLW